MLKTAEFVYLVSEVSGKFLPCPAYSIIANFVLGDKDDDVIAYIEKLGKIYGSARKLKLQEAAPQISGD